MTLIRISYNRRFAFYRVAFQYIHRTDLHTQIAPIADFFVENNGSKHDAPPNDPFVYFPIGGFTPEAIRQVFLRR